MFGLFIGSWSSYPCMHVGLLCNVKPTSTHSPCNAYHILTELSVSFECIVLGRNRFGDLEQHGWAPVWSSKQLAKEFFFLKILIFSKGLLRRRLPAEIAARWGCRFSITYLTPHFNSFMSPFIVVLTLKLPGGGANGPTFKIIGYGSHMKKQMCYLECM